MCGILGLTSTSNLSGRQGVFKKANDSIAYRGPDADGFLAYDNQKKTFTSGPSVLDQNRIKVLFGHRRLAIIELTSAGLQPMIDEALGLAITFNGEIYNYKEIQQELKQKGYQFQSNSDTEVILKAYAHWGRNCVHHFHGMWAFSIIDKNTESKIDITFKITKMQFQLLIDMIENDDDINENHIIVPSEYVDISYPIIKHFVQSLENDLNKCECNEKIIKTILIKLAM